MAGFRAATTPAWRIDHWWDDRNNRLAFARDAVVIHVEARLLE
ncbi:MAG: hypothetical protein AB2551_15020 [Candidatus Thiodiazotropha sp.]